MALAAGARLGPYEIVAALGAGGMGEVYQARDTRLDRTVAIKVLPPELSTDPERRARFEREARTIAALNHPHICTLHDIGTHEGATFLVMEHLAGETLADRLEKGPLPLSQALAIGAQIAEALDAAHEHGIVHRDLKPANVKLTPDGAVKVLDFGLARAFENAAGGADLAGSPAITSPAVTRAGVILGTAAYMSPEQARGAAVDKRADIWAFGVVLFEMLTGRRLFDGETVSDTLASVLRAEPNWAMLPSETPTCVRQLLRRTLAKDRGHRLHDIADARLEIEEAISATGEGASNVALAAGVPPPTRSAVSLAPWALAAVATLGVGLVGMAIASLRRPSEPAPVIRFDVPPPEGTELQFYLAVSPDGSRLVFTARGEDGLDRLYVRSLASGRSVRIPGTEGALQPFWSPDARSLGFFSQGKLKRVEFDGGAPQAICSLPEPRGATWNRDGVILFGTGGAYGLHRVAATGGNPEPVSQPDATRGETSHRWPYFLLDGRRFVYVAISAGGGSVFLGSLDGQKPERLLDMFSAPTYVPSGYLLFVREGALRAQLLDAAAARLTGEPATLAEPVALDANMWGGAPVAAGGAVLAYRSGDIVATRLTWLDREGRELGSVGPPGHYSDIALSPDGGRLVATGPKSKQLVMADLRTGVLMPFTFKTERVVYPAWSPDGRSIAYASNRKGMFNIFLVSASGGGAEETLVQGSATTWCNGFSPDGRFLLYENSDPKTQYDLWVVPLSGDRTPYPFLRTDATETHAFFSPKYLTS